MEPVDFQAIDRNINTGIYSSAYQFDRDVIRLCQNNLRYYGHNSREGGAALQIRKLYNTIKQEYHSPLSEIVGDGGAETFKKRAEMKVTEDVIRCPCGQFTEEGTMIQCDKCQVWQHSDCVGREDVEDSNVTDDDEEEYLCETCGRREANLDIALLPQPEYACPGEKYYVSLVRNDDMQVRLGDTVYVLRAFKTNPDDIGQSEAPPPCRAGGVQGAGETGGGDDAQQARSADEVKPTSENSESEHNQLEADVEQERQASTANTNCIAASPGASDATLKDGGASGEQNRKELFNQGGIPHKMMSPTKGPSLASSSLAKGSYPTYKTASSDISTSDMDIFRIERLWVNEKGERFAFGHHYLRPHETFHEPSRKFFRNEVFRVPIYEVLPLDTIWGQCWVLDLNTFCKGRPIGAVEEHVYICEYRVDKGARLFNKISKPKHVICTKEYAFDHFDQKLRPARTYAVRASANLVSSLSGDLALCGSVDNHIEYDGNLRGFVSLETISEPYDLNSMHLVTYLSEDNLHIEYGSSINYVIKNFWFFDPLPPHCCKRPVDKEQLAYDFFLQFYSHVLCP